MKKYILVSTLVLGMFGAFASNSQATQKAAKENKKEEYQSNGFFHDFHC